MTRGSDDPECACGIALGLADAVKRRRLMHNVAQHVALPAVRAVEREPWTVAPAVTFLDHTHRVDDRLAELFEVIIGTGLRRGEALALHWSDVDLLARVLSVPRTGARCPMSPGG